MSGAAVTAATIAVAAVTAAPDWPGPEHPALIRFDVELGRPPSHASAGYIVRIPDGGLLPRPAPALAVIDRQGNSLRYGCLWHDPDQGLTLVFAGPARGGSVRIYAWAGASVERWRPDSGLTPSVLGFLQPGGAHVGAAQRLAQGALPGRGVYFEQLSAMGSGGLPQGLPGRFADYVLGYVAAPAPGKTWIAPLSTDGAAEVWIDGRRVAAKRESDLQAGTGGWVELTEGLHRVELFGFRPSEHSRFQMVWSPPGTPASELGAASDSAAPHWAGRPIKRDECVFSGDARVTGAALRDGRPVAACGARAEGYFWFADAPVILYALEAPPLDPRPGAAFSWRPGRDLALDGPSRLLWLFDAFQDAAVTVSITVDGRSTTCGSRFATFCPGNLRSDIHSASDRQRYREAFVNMLRAQPPAADPTAGWSRSMWDLYARLADPAEGRELLTGIFDARWESVAPRLGAEQRWRFAHQFLDMTLGRDPAAARSWVDRFEAAEPDMLRKAEWKLRRAEVLMHYLGERDAAQREIEPLLTMPGATGERARVRLGDLALVSGRYDQATALYGDVQNRVRHAERVRSEPRGPAPAAPPRLARSTAEAEQQRAARAALTRLPGLGSELVADWRIGAVRDTAASETVRGLIDQGFYQEAREALDAWELEFPMAKMAGDFFVVEARLRMQAGDTRRPLTTLVAHCRAVEMSSYVEEAMRLILECARQGGTAAPPELRAFAAEMKERLVEHPAGDAARELAVLAGAVDAGAGP